MAGRDPDTEVEAGRITITRLIAEDGTYVETIAHDEDGHEMPMYDFFAMIGMAVWDLAVTRARAELEDSGPEPDDREDEQPD